MSEPTPSDPTPAPEPKPTPSPDAWQSALSTLEPELRGDPSLKNIDSVGAALKSYVHAQRLLGSQTIGLPGEKATPGDWNSFYAKLGRPEKPDGYKPVLEGFQPPEGIPWDETLVPTMLEKFHAAGLMPKQARQLVEAYAEMEQGFYQRQQESASVRSAESEELLRRQYGEKYEVVKEQAVQAVVELVGGNPQRANEFVAIPLADGTQLGDHPVFFEMMARIGANIQNDEVAGAKRSTTGRPLDAVVAEIAKMEGEAVANPNHPLTSKTHPEHEIYMARRMRLYEERAALEGKPAGAEDWR